MSNRKQITLSVSIVAVAVAAVMAYSLLGHAGEPRPGGAGGHDHAAMAAAAQGARERTLSISEARARRIGVAYATAHRSVLRPVVRAVGTIAWDETRLATVNPKIDGWVERLFVDYTGAPVRKGQPLAAVYSPMLVAAQEELALARRLADEVAAAPDDVAAANARELLEAARRRLAYLDIPADVIARIERTGQAQRTVLLRSPIDGVVTEKTVVQGSRIMPGMDLFRIAGLGAVWVEGEVFEKDLGLVHLGQPATVTIDAYPGETFHGRVTFIDPAVALEGRTGKVRIELPNPGLRLKPGMYATVQLDAPAGAPALVVPRSAVLTTGERALVFVRHDDGMLMPHEVKTGLAVGDSIQVLAGIWDGATVVSSAGFLVDAESNLGAALQSMPGMEMGPAGGGATHDAAHGTTPGAATHAAHAGAAATSGQKARLP
ncbi:MAG: efflux RND transporter periplasmic adaptor subunit [Gemmatimonadetes bacterium]|nr:efflux RND transporter periplasmic adaptor subunit [Gemmatimonadota bacterium]